MVRSIGLGFVVAAIAGAPVAIADVHDFPSAGSSVVASIGFIDGEQIGYFWTATRGDSVQQTFADPQASIGSAKWEFDVVTNGLSETLSWQMLINGTAVGKFEVAPGVLGPQTVEFDFPPVAAVGGQYTVRVEATSVVSPGAGAHTLRYAGAGSHQITLGAGGGGGGCYADCDESGSLDFFDFLCFQNAFAAGQKYADCDGSGSLDFFDFLCFQNEFAAGCPSGGEIDRLGVEAPPSSYCGERMTQFPVDPRAIFTDVTTVASPLGGDVQFSSACNLRQIGSGWASWSHGYTGSVYYTNGATKLEVIPPANSAFYLYVEPNPFALIEFEIIRDGGASVVESIDGSSGAKGYGFCGGVKSVVVRTTDEVTDFAVGEFGIAN